jgi:hypothetical protein
MGFELVAGPQLCGRSGFRRLRRSPFVAAGYARGLPNFKTAQNFGGFSTVREDWRSVWDDFRTWLIQSA